MSKKRKLFPNGILNSGAASLVRGLIGRSNPIVGGVIGTVEGVVNRFKDIPKRNKASKVGGEGKIDWYEWIGIISSALGIIFVLGYSAYQLINGEISLQEFIDFNKVD